jgi:hypothetical protein
MDRLRLKDGRFISRACPVPTCCGTLQQEGRNWVCDGLRDPDRSDKPLEACDYTIYDGEVYGLPQQA